MASILSLYIETLYIYRNMSIHYIDVVLRYIAFVMLLPKRITLLIIASDFGEGACFRALIPLKGVHEDLFTRTLYRNKT